MKKEIPLTKSTCLINPGCVILATVKDQEHTNIITIAWQTPLSIKPRLLGISVGFSRHSHHLFLEHKEFVINIPGKKLLREVNGCGSMSGKKINKFQHFNLSEEPGKTIATPGIKECLGSIECKVTDHFTTGDHTFFVGKVNGAYAEETAYDYINNTWKTNSETELLYHLGNNHYITGSTYFSA